MRKWVFDDTPGKYEIDLSRSYIDGGRLSELTLPPDLELGYGADRGTEPLREQIASLYKGHADSVLVTHGAQEALALAYSTLLRPGDQVVTFRPGWQQSWDAPDLMGCQVEAIDLDQDLGIDLAAVAERVSSRLRMIVVNSPCNPTGRRARRAELDALLRTVTEHDGYLLLDQNYEPDLSTSAAIDSDRVISVSGLSKIYGFPGLRVGWMYGAPEIVQACAEHKHLTSIANSVLCEVLACDVLSRSEHYLSKYRREVSAGIDILTRWSAQHQDTLRLTPPEETPFGWFQLLDGSDSMSFCRQALEQGVLLMPAETLGGVSGFRVGVAIPPAELSEGLRRIDYILANQHDFERRTTG